MWRIWLAATRDPEAGDVTCVLDALDECKEAERGKMIRCLTEFYKELSTMTVLSSRRNGPLKFLVASRPYDDIHRGFNAIPSSLPIIRLRGEDQDDEISLEIDLVIKAQAQRLAYDLNLKSQTKVDIENKILLMNHRTYLWLHFAIEDIYQTYRRSIRAENEIDVINMIPSSVEHAYEKILGRTSARDTTVVKKILIIIVGARRPLTVGEISIILGMTTPSEQVRLANMRLDSDHLEDTIRHICNLFVFIHHSRFFLIHQTAKEFLIRSWNVTCPLAEWKHSFDALEVEREMARLSTDFLRLEEVRAVADLAGSRFTGDNPLLSTPDQISQKCISPRVRRTTPVSCLALNIPPSQAFDLFNVSNADPLNDITPFITEPCALSLQST